MAQKKHKIKKLSESVAENRNYSSQEIMGVLREVAVRLEIVGRDRRDDLIDAMDTLCTCPPRSAKHLSVCPQARRIEE